MASLQNLRYFRPVVIVENFSLSSNISFIF